MFRRRAIQILTAGLGIGGAYAAFKTLSPTSSQGGSMGELVSFELTQSPPFHQFVHIPGNENLVPSGRLTLYQFRSCPFCCKLRTYLDYYNYPYDVVEVNSIGRKQVKWSICRKLPVLTIQLKDSSKGVQLFDSSLTISALHSVFFLKGISLGSLQDCYQLFKQDGKLSCDNKYFLMLGDREVSDDQKLKSKNERKWRRWTDDVLIHTIAPNIYRTPTEARQAFSYFEEVGEWDKRFSKYERKLIYSFGSSAMYILGKLLRRKYHLNADVRESLYAACNDWLAEVDKRGTRFHGGEKPDLADLAVYGVLSAIEGCLAFSDLKQLTRIEDWYSAVQETVSNHLGASEHSN